MVYWEKKATGLMGKRITIEADINDHGFHVYYTKGYATDVEQKSQELAAIGW